MTKTRNPFDDSAHVARYAERAAQMVAADVDKARTAITTEVPVLSPAQDRAVLLEAGFTDVTEFFSAFTFRGWVCYA